MAQVSAAKQVRAAVDVGGCRVRTRYGQWREVVAVYSDDTFGTVVAGKSAADARRWRILDASEIAEVEAIAKVEG